MAKPLMTAGQAKVNIFFLQIEGDSATVQRTVETAQQAFLRPYLSPARPVPPVAPRSAPPEQLTLAEVSQPSSEVEEAQPTEGAPVPQHQRPARKRSPSPIPKILDDLRCHEDPEPFKAFAERHKVGSDVERGLVAAVWLREHRQVTAFSIHHIHTCFSMTANWRVPDEPASLLRQMKRQPKQWIRKLPNGMWELTTSGVNAYKALGG